MHGAERAAQQRHAVGRGRRHGDIHIDPGIEHGAPEADRRHAVGQVHAHHRAVLGPELEALGGQAVIKRGDVVPELLAQLGPGLDHPERLADRGHDRGRQGGREHVGARGHAQDVEVGVVGDAIAADRAQGLGKGADDEVAVIEHAHRLAEAATMLAQRAHRVGLVDQHIGAVLLADLDELLEWRRIAQHRVDAFQHHQLVARLVADAAQPRLEAGRIVVLEAHHLGLGLLAGIVDRGVAVGVDQQEVVRPDQGGNNPQVGLVAGREDHAVLFAVELGDLLFQRHML